MQKQKKDAIYCRYHYEKNFPQMGEILYLFKQKYPHLRHNQQNPHISLFMPV
jgi:hypothetical protein